MVPGHWVRNLNARREPQGTWAGKSRSDYKWCIANHPRAVPEDYLVRLKLKTDTIDDPRRALFMALFGSLGFRVQSCRHSVYRMNHVHLWNISTTR